MDDFVRSKLTEWGLSELIKDFEEEGIGKETFLSLGESDDINDLIPKIGPRAKFRKGLKEYLAWNYSETCDFVHNKLTESDLKELIPRFEDEGIDKEKFLSLGDSDAISALISKIGARVKYLQNYGDELMAKKINGENGITDVKDGKMYQNLLHQGISAPDDITLSWNCDELQVFGLAKKNPPQNGVKGSSLLSKIPFFDIVLGFVPEYLHSVLLGVSKQLMSLWLDPANSLKPWYVGEKISEMDSRLRHIRTPSEISTSPQSLQCRDKWKASEWRAFLLFYAVSVLPGILVPPYLEHYLSFSFSIHILLQESISQQDLHLAHRTLVYFVEFMAKLYGEENTTFNCHQLIHLTQSVENWGPLWAISAFNFERNNGNLRTLLKGVKVKSQVHQRFLLWLHLPSHLSSSVFNKKCSFSELLAKVTPVKGSSSDKAFGNPHQVELTGSTQRAIAEFLNQPVYAKTADACDRFLHGHTIYKASNCKESDKTDCFVQLNNGSYGDIQWILRLKESCVCKSSCSRQAAPVFVLQLYDIKPSTLFSAAHPNNTSKAIFIQVEKADQVKACSLEDIRCKCVYMDGWLVPLPNTYER
ncbi:uncharacterized protein V6R79_019117 [Siganus canaliculatus]